MKKQQLLMFAGILIVAVAVGVSIYVVTKPKATPSTNNQQALGGDRDEYGCIPSAGYTWSQTKQKCVQPWEESVLPDDQVAVQQLLAQKYGKTIAELSLSAINQSPEYMSGKFSTVAALDKNSPSGRFLAAKRDGGWRLVYDGDTKPDCKAIKTGYTWPLGMLEGFCK
ncbi:MAG: hypothetical protein ACM3NH_01990 [Candidatus Saccharibacteria bacterium]